MMKKAFILLCSLVFLPSGISFAAYTEVVTSQGKIIRGMSRDEAVKQFGYPQAVGEETWLYRKGGEEIYVYLPAQPAVSLYPKTVHVQPGNVLELKVFAGLPEGVSAEVTKDAVFFCSDPAAFTIRNHDVFIPEKGGEYTVVARYKGYSSNACRISVQENEKKSGADDQERLLGIEVLPYAPVVYEREELQFMALGVFCSGPDDYTVRDISGNAEWGAADGGHTVVKGPRLLFPAPERVAVSCTYNGVKSYSQTVTVEASSLKRRSEELRHITILPELMKVSLKKTFTVTVMATYEDNRVRDVTRDCRFNIQKDPCVILEKPGLFSAVAEGICEISAEVGGMRSGDLKVIVTSDEKTLDRRPLPLPEKKKPTMKQAGRDIENEVNKLAQNIASPEKKVVSIRLSPPEVTLGLGSTSNISATAFHSDGSQSDVTVTALWAVADASCAGVDKGVLTARFPGETRVTAQYKSVQSPSARITVEKPHLVSIALTPESVRMSMFQKPLLKAEGVLSDSSRKDMTGEVSWRVEGRSVLVSRGVVSGIHFGVNKVFARFEGVESLPVTVNVVVTPLWVFLVVSGIFFLLLALAGTVVFFLYIEVKRKAERIRQMRPTTAAYIIALYGNARDVCALFGFTAYAFDCPLDVAARAEERFGLGKRFFRFTQQFEEAKYSTHHLSPEYMEEAEKAYSMIVTILFSDIKRMQKCKLLLVSLIRRVPLFLT